MPEEQDSNVFRILITNDNHIGFKEDDKVRNRDALTTFEEILQIARSMKVDFVLHSGDLFDDARPNRFWMNATMRLFRQYCFGDGGVNFHQIPSEFSRLANFEDVNMNIDLPVFMIHGNHDDAGGEFGDARALSCGDLLETANLVTYFGKHENIEEEIQISPILLRKGSTKLALYGLGNIRDDRLHRMFVSKKVSFLAPPDGGYFNLMSIHQNRFRGNANGAPSKNCIHPTFLPSFLNLVVWAHEHECIPSPEESVEAGFHILQSGSSVATSLTNSEKMSKNVFLLEISSENGEPKFRCTPIPLQTVRPLLIDEVMSSSTNLVSLVEGMIKKNIVRKIDFSTFLFPPVRPELPLIRVRVNDDDEANLGSHIMNQKFGRQFVDRVANPDEIVHVIKTRKGFGRKRRLNDGVVQLEIEDEENVQDLIFNYMGGTDGEALLDVLVEPDFNVAVQEYVHKSDLQAIDRFVKNQLDLMAKAALESRANDVTSVSEVVKKRALDARNECLNRAQLAEARQVDENVEDLFEVPATKRNARSAEISFRDNNSIHAESILANNADNSMHAESILANNADNSMHAENFSINKTNNSMHAEKMSINKTKNSMEVDSTPISPNPMVAAMLRPMSSQNSQWARRM